MKKIIYALFISLSAITSCNKNSDESITLHNVENNYVAITYPNSEKIAISIIGGDGNYSASCNNISIVEVEVVSEKKMLLINPKSIGDATITITDKSNNYYIFNVKVSYHERNFIIIKQDVVITGNKISTAQKKEIEQKALKTLPVNINGGYKLIYNDEQNRKGELFIYKDKYNELGEKTTFEETRVQIENSEYNYLSYTFNINGITREFHLLKYTNPTKMVAQTPYALVEDITYLFKADYPNIELVITQQLFK